MRLTNIYYILSSQVRLYLSVSGIVSIGMGLVIAMGIGSALGFPYTPMHAGFPFICLGIGWVNIGRYFKKSKVLDLEQHDPPLTCL